MPITQAQLQAHFQRQQEAEQLASQYQEEERARLMGEWSNLPPDIRQQAIQSGFFPQWFVAEQQPVAPFSGRGMGLPVGRPPRKGPAQFDEQDWVDWSNTTGNKIPSRFKPQTTPVTTTPTTASAPKPRAPVMPFLPRDPVTATPTGSNPAPVTPPAPPMGSANTAGTVAVGMGSSRPDRDENSVMSDPHRARPTTFRYK
jgi:hypothetical protein